MRITEVNDRMQRGYRYALSAPIGREFHAEFTPDLTPPEMLRLGVFGGKYDRHNSRISEGVVHRSEAVAGKA